MRTLTNVRDETFFKKFRGCSPPPMEELTKFVHALVENRYIEDTQNILSLSVRI